MIALPSCDAAISCVRWQLLPTEKFHFRCCTFRIKNNPRLHFQRNIRVNYGVLCESNSSFEVHTVTLATLTYKENFFFRSKKKPLLLLAFKCLHKHLSSDHVRKLRSHGERGGWYRDSLWFIQPPLSRSVNQRGKHSFLGNHEWT